MTMRPFTDARGGLNHLVDAQIGRAFPVVHKVYQHLDAIEYVAKVYEDGRARDIVLRTNRTKEWIEWQYKGEAKWTILFKFSDLLGADIADVVAAEQAIAAELVALRAHIDQTRTDTLAARDRAQAAELGAVAVKGATEVIAATAATYRDAAAQSAQQAAASSTSANSAKNTAVSAKTAAESSAAAALTSKNQAGVSATAAAASAATATEKQSEVSTLHGAAVTASTTATAKAAEAAASASSASASATTAATKASEAASSAASAASALNTKVDKVAGKQLSTEDFTSAEKAKLSGIASGAQVNTVTAVAGRTGNVALTKADVGLANVDNTSDADKPVSLATQASLDGKAATLHGHDITDVTDLQAALDGKEPTIAAGTATQYWRGDKTWRDFFTDVRAATLTGLSTATNAVVAATDTVLAAIGKLQAQVSAKFDKTGGDVNGNINFTGTARRITGDFSNATVANRTLFQTGVANDATDLTIVPNGTATYAAVSARSSYSENASVAALAVDGAAVTLASNKTGSGAYLPLTFHTGNAERLRIDPTTGNVLATSGAIGYGMGAGGTVMQATSKSTAVTLNKPCGRIVMHIAALAPSGTVTFVLNNSALETGDGLHIELDGSKTSPVDYTVVASTGYSGAYITLRNVSGGSLSNSVVLTFRQIKGAFS